MIPVLVYSFVMEIENETKNREMGEQPIAAIMRKHELVAKDLVRASERPMTFKMVARAVKGRWLTPNTKSIVLDALNRATGESYRMTDLFNY